MTTAQELIEAIKAGDKSQVEQILAANPALANARSDVGTSAVLYAMYYGHAPLAELLVAAGATLDIFEAATVGDLARVKTLVAANPTSVTAFAHDGFTALHLAAFFGHAAIAEFLLAAGAEVNAVARNPQKVMPLHSAVSSNRLDVTRVLLAHHAAVNEAQEAGFTPLHESAQNGNLEITQLLLDAQADVNNRKSDGRTPLMLAEEHHHDALAALLRQHGATQSS